MEGAVLGELVTKIQRTGYGLVMLLLLLSWQGEGIRDETKCLMVAILRNHYSDRVGSIPEYL